MDIATAMWTDLRAAKDKADLDRLYVEWIGYSIVEDDPNKTESEIRSTLRDYIEEACCHMELTETPYGTYTFEHEGFAIHYPVCDSSGRFPMSPEEYGFTVWGTGGGNTAWHREFTLKGEPVYMLITDDDLGHDVKYGDQIVVGVYNDESEAIAVWTQDEGDIESTPPTNVLLGPL